MKQSSVEILKSREHLQIGYDSTTGGYTIEFRLNIGIGSSSIRIPVELMPSIINILEDGLKPAVNNVVTDTIYSSLTHDVDEAGEEIITFRTRYGRGSKLQKIRKAEYAQVITVLRQLAKQIPEVIAEYEDINK